MSHEIIESIAGTSRSAEESAKEFIFAFEHLPKPEIVEAIIVGGSLDRARAVADAAIAIDPKSPASLWLAGRVALEQDDPDRAIALLSAARSDHAEVRVTLALALWEKARIGDALIELERASRADPLLDEAQEEYALAISAVAMRLDVETGEPWPCPCGSGAQYHECCKPREQAALHRFLDDEPFEEFVNRVRDYAREPALASARANNEAAWSEVGVPALAGVPIVDLPAATLRGLDSAPVGKGSRHTVMSRFAFDVRTDSDDRKRARDWVEHATYGVWHFCEDFDQPPGALVHDEIGGNIHFVHPGASLARRELFLGRVATFDGVWRVAPGAMTLTEDEAGRIRESVLDTFREFVLSGSFEIEDPLRKLVSETLDETAPGDPFPAPISALLSEFVGTMLPALVADVLQGRAESSLPEPRVAARGRATAALPARAMKPVLDETELTTAASESVMVADVKALLSMLRDKGAKLTAKGHLSIAHGRELAAATGVDFDTHIGNSVFKTKSAGEHARIALAVAWARAAGLVRVANRTMTPTKRAERFGASPLDDWLTLFDAFCGKLNQIQQRTADAFGHAWIPDLEQLLPTLLEELYSAGGEPVSIEHLADLAREILHARYVVPETPYERTWTLSDIGRRIVRPLGLLGALTEHHEAVELNGRSTKDKRLSAASVTPLGQWVLGGRRNAGGCVKRSAGTREILLHVSLSDINPSIWRRVAVPDDVTLLQLHRILQAAMGWQDYHLFDFEIGGTRIGIPSAEFEDHCLDAATVLLRDVGLVAGASFLYRYDFGDDWEHVITVEAIAKANGWPRLACLDGARACPPEDCGGAEGFAELLEVLGRPNDPQHDEMTEWVGGAFDPERFDLVRANDAVGFAAR